MAASRETVELDKVPEAVVDSEHKGLPVVWLLPLVALLVGGWLFYKTMAEKGPEITLVFSTAEGIEEGKTKIKFRDVTVGQVDRIHLSDDMKSVELSATLIPDARNYLTSESRFWVVKPRVGTGGVSGLGTLLSGAYIAFEPVGEGKPTKKFIGLEKPPIVSIDKEGTRYRLRADSLGSLSIGSPVYFRQLDIGEVTEYKLADDYSHVDIGIFIESPYDEYVRTGTRFWNAGGVRLSMSASGVTLEMESFFSVLSGGVAFETLPDFIDTPRAQDGARFDLFANRMKSLEQPITEVVTYVLRFKGTVRGLTEGAPVEYRGLRIGTVRAIELGRDAQFEDVVSPVVLIDVEPQRTMAYRDIDEMTARGRADSKYEKDPRGRVAELVKKGLRARLQTGNLVTGQLFVELDIFPDAPAAEVKMSGPYQEIPTLPNSLEGIIASVNRILDRVEKSDLQGTLDNLNQLMVSANGLVTELERNTPQLAGELRTTLKTANSALVALESTAAADGEIGGQVQAALREVSAAARSIRVMAEYLERHPDALLRGKGAP